MRWKPVWVEVKRLGYLRNDQSFQTFRFYCRLEQEYYYRQDEEGRMESEVELDSDHDDGEHDLSHGHWMGHPEDPNKVGHSQGQTVWVHALSRSHSDKDHQGLQVLKLAVLI